MPGLSAMPKSRLDQLVVERGLAPSRERARALILAGQVTVDGQPVTKAGARVDSGADVTLLAPDHPYVGRGGVKLAHALDTFGSTSRDARRSTSARPPAASPTCCCSAAPRAWSPSTSVTGRSTGRCATIPRVVVIEHFNARRLSAADLPGPVDIVVIDVSFISLRQIFPVVPPLLRPGADVVALVKPQFEAGRAEVRKGVIRDDAIHLRVWTRLRLPPLR